MGEGKKKKKEKKQSLFPIIPHWRPYGKKGIIGTLLRLSDSENGRKSAAGTQENTKTERVYAKVKQEPWGRIGKRERRGRPAFGAKRGADCAGGKQPKRKTRKSGGGGTNRTGIFHGVGER